MLTYKDFTLKAHLKSRSETEQKLIELGARFEGEDHQQDDYFKISKGKLKYRKGTLGGLITHYERFLEDNIEKTIVYRYDKNPPEEEIRQLYDSSELIGTTHKIRKLYQFENVTFHFDELPDGQTFIEVEAKDYENQYSEPELQNQCRKWMSKLGITESDFLPTGYI